MFKQTNQTLDFWDEPLAPTGESTIMDHNTGGRKIKVVLAKSEMDAHDRGVRYLAMVLREQGMEVVFTRYRIVDEVVTIVREEDADVIGLSFYGSGLIFDTTRTLDLLKEMQMTDVLIIVGGTIPEDAAQALKKNGIRGVFTPGRRLKKW